MSSELLNLLNNAFILATIVGLLKLAYLIISMKFKLNHHGEKIDDLESFVYPKEIGSIKK